MINEVLSIEGLSIVYATPRGDLSALRRVDLKAAAGEIVGVVGESGCGKSTLVGAVFRLLASNARIVAGAIRIEGQDIAALDEAGMRALRGRRIAVVSQDPMTALNPVISIGAQMIDIQYRESSSRAEKRRRALEMLGKVGIPDAARRFDDPPHRFSGGMRQRIAIAMALMGDPGLLVADEPTTALDATLEGEIVELIRRLRDETGSAVLFVSHNLGLVSELCDSIVVMYAGEVVERLPARAVATDCRHPYTQALIACDPARIASTPALFPTIPGQVPDLVDPPSGCIFRPRCPVAFERCVEAPTLRPIDSSHDVACWRAAP